MSKESLTGRLSNQEPEPQYYGKSGEYIIWDDFSDNISKEDMDRFYNEITNTIDYSEIEKRVLAFTNGEDVYLDEVVIDSINEHLIHNQPDFRMRSGQCFDLKTVQDIPSIKSPSHKMQMNVYAAIAALSMSGYDNNHGFRERSHKRTNGEATKRNKILNKRAINKANRKRARHG